MASRYYSSDEEVSWGPLTLREIKRDFRNPSLKRALSRHSCAKSFTSTGNLIPDNVQSEKVEKCNVSGTSTQYFTSNETLSHPSSINSSMYTAQWNPEYDIDNFRLTLVDNDSKDSLGQSAGGFSIDSLEAAREGQNGSESVIVLSSDDDDYEHLSYTRKNIKTSPCSSYNLTSDLTKHEKTGYSMGDNEDSSDFEDLDASFAKGMQINVKEQYHCNDRSTDSHQFDQKQEIQTDDILNSELIGGNDHSSDWEDLDVNEQYHCKDSSKSDENREIKTDHKPNNFQKLDGEVEIGYTTEQSGDRSDIQNPEAALTNVLRINADDQQKFEGADNSYDSDDGQYLNTTMDEIERMLNQQPVSHTTQKRVEERPLSDFNPRGRSQIPLPVANDCFKVPQRTPAKKLATPKQKLKDVVSPIGLYIKYSPQPNLKVNVCRSEDRKIAPSKAAPRKTPQKLDSLPTAIYKPSKNAITSSTKKNLFLPASLAKLVQEPKSTKHEGRLNSRVDDREVEFLLSTETDLTRASINDSQLNETNADISVLVSKNTFI